MLGGQPALPAGRPKFDRRRCNFCSVIEGEKLISYLKPYLSGIKVIAIDAPLTLGPGKGKMRLWEKFLLTKPFRQYKVNPILPAAIWRLSYHGMEVVSRLSDYGKLFLPALSFWKKDWRERFK